MKNQKNILAALLCGSLLAGAIMGCDDPNARASRPVKKPSVLATIAGQIEPSVDASAYPLKPPSVFSIDGQDAFFPSSKLAVVSHGSSGFAVRLCSEDPASAIDPGYAGNSYSLDFFVPIDRLSDLPGYQCSFKPADDDSVSGFFLHGFREQLHPLDLHLLFQKDGDDLVITLTGSASTSTQKIPRLRPSV